MLFNTHVRMGSQLHAWMSREQSRMLPRQAFVYGNIKPDLVRKRSGERHTFQDSWSIVTELCDRLLGSPGEKSRCAAEDAVAVGSICHYVSDAFCRFHYDPTLYANLSHHFTYEVGLHKRFLRLLYADRLPGRKAVVPEPGGHHAGIDLPSITPRTVIPSLFRHLEAQIAEYGETEPSFDLDIVYSMNNCVHVLDMLLPCLVPPQSIPDLIPVQDESLYAFRAELDTIPWRDAV